MEPEGLARRAPTKGLSSSTGWDASARTSASPSHTVSSLLSPAPGRRRTALEEGQWLLWKGKGSGSDVGDLQNPCVCKEGGGSRRKYCKVCVDPRPAEGPYRAKVRD